MNENELRRQALQSALAKIRASQSQTTESLKNLDRILKVKAETGHMFLDNATQGEALIKEFGWDQVLRREYGSPDGCYQGKFFCSKADEINALEGEPSFWIRVVLPQMYANRRPDLFDMIGGLPEPRWIIGRP